MMANYASMCNDQLEGNAPTKPPTEVTRSNTRLIQAGSYSAGPRSCQLERPEVEEMAKDGVAESTTTEWASTPIFSQRRMEDFVLHQLQTIERNESSRQMPRSMYGRGNGLVW